MNGEHRPMRCPKCARDVAEAAPICPGCDFILDTSFLSSVLDDPTTGFPVPDRAGPPSTSSTGPDALILGNLEEEFDSFLSDATGTFMVPEAAGASIVPANVYVDRRTLDLLRPEAVLALKPGALASLSGVERRVAQLLDGKRPVARVWRKSALSKSDLSVALAILVDKGLLHLVGVVEKDASGEVLFVEEDDGADGGEEIVVEEGDPFDDATQLGIDLPGMSLSAPEVASEDPQLTPEDLAALEALDRRDQHDDPSPWEERTAPIEQTPPPAAPSVVAPPAAAKAPPAVAPSVVAPSVVAKAPSVAAPSVVAPSVAAKAAPAVSTAPPVVVAAEKAEPTKPGAKRGISMADDVDVTGRHVAPLDAVPAEREASGLRPNPSDAPPAPLRPAPPLPRPTPWSPSEAPPPAGGVVGLPGVRPAAAARPAPAPPAPSASAPAAAPPRRAPVVIEKPAARPFDRKGVVVPPVKLKAAELYELAQKDRAAGNLSRGLMYAKMAVEQDPDEPRYRELVATWAQAAETQKKGEPEEVKLFQQAQRAEERGDAKKAVELLQHALEVAPRSASLHNYLGVVLATRLKDYDRATHHLMQACELDPKNPAYKNNLGKVVARGSFSTTKKQEGGGLLALLRKKLF